MNSPSHLSNSDSHNSDFSLMPSAKGHGPIHIREPTCMDSSRTGVNTNMATPPATIKQELLAKCRRHTNVVYQTMKLSSVSRIGNERTKYDTLWYSSKDAVVGSYNPSFWICLVAVARLGAGGSWVAGTEYALTTRIFIQNFLWPFLTLTHRTWSQDLKKTETYQVSSLRHFVLIFGEHSLPCCGPLQSWQKETQPQVGQGITVS